MTDVERRNAAGQFMQDWANRGDEKQETQLFWISLLHDVLGIEEPTKFIQFELPVKLDHTSFIDGYIPATRVLIEQKGRDIDLHKGYKQSDGSMLTPYQQARRYAGYLPHDQNPRWIVVCNFQEFQIHDMNRPNDEPEILKLEGLEREYHRLNFLVDTGSEHIKKEMEISLQAGELVGVLYDALLKQYKDPSDPEVLKSLNKLCVRLVFCLYAEDAGIFGGRNMFHDYLQVHEREARQALINLFKILDTKSEDRDPYLDDDLLAFPYVNGGLFADENIIIPRLDETIVDLILHRASEDFDWSEISPTIFGAVFESTLNPETRRSGGMHYTSIENIHKLIDPLFLDGLKAEFAEIKEISVDRTRKAKLEVFQRKLAGLKFLDPACGSGNFLTETYISLRRLENETISLLNKGQIMFDLGNPIQVSIGQFYGIEINDFAVTVAKTALWIAESQMMKETEDVVHMSLDFLPLKSYANITEGNALRTDWESVVSKRELNYIMGNPPFVGYSLQSKAQKEDILCIYVDEKGKPYKTAGKIDYVSGWYFKAAQLMQGTSIRTAFVSTNSITQGEQVAGVWKPLYDRFGVHIDFAHRTFRWDSEASLKAHVHCVIVGFSIAPNTQERRLFMSERMQVVTNINSYLVDADNVFIEARNRPVSDVPILQNGGKSTEGGFLILTEEEKEELLKTEPQATQFIRPYMMGKDFIMRRPRYCLWMVGANPATINQCRSVKQRIEEVRKYRLASPKEATKRKAETPMLFDEVRECATDYVAIPKVSSENRRYVPIEYLKREVIPGDSIFMISDTSLYHFGILTSNVHMAWMRAVCGRLKSDYRYSNTVVYNNFPWPTPTDKQKAIIEQTAQAILDARALYPDSSLADLYDETTMPPDLRKAHQNNDRAVMAAYGFSVREMTESRCVAELMRMYQRLTDGDL
ncbi:class I SAM-dependent DNA methyltransferase [Oscillospiraceae bacterium 21-37]|uniref:class I SAM-dependent DNA methyltransferase n=1 Tax=unclassified Neglectibacter TaxID=2632164 RepID=UPI00136A3E8F|nr:MULTISPECIES: class I SAM-dependent DNA methyltransferase [unclassified Neglectibacter]NBI19010.1 class I SAM-dependent DNA methyltransferase [Neglectibacter sp. 59]NBJ74683.1 class I SAM-dependent DNA methyltransferase [Neglectibacter sp. X4]NCE82481.1 class I SAM-dependent DNA methyltransferase [Neglectibacter sp. X58]